MSEPTTVTIEDCATDDSPPNWWVQHVGGPTPVCRVPSNGRETGPDEYPSGSPYRSDAEWHFPNRRAAERFCRRKGLVVVPEAVWNKFVRRRAR